MLDGALDPSFGQGGTLTTGFAAEFGRAPMAIGSDGKIVLADVTAGSFQLTRLQAGGNVDTSFGTNGIVTTTILGSSRVSSVAVQNDRMVLVAGLARAAGGQLDSPVLARYTIGGTLDAGFGSGGKVVIDSKGLFGSTATIVGSDLVATQSNGKIILVGYGEDNTFSFKYFVSRYTSAGVLDATFGNGGTVIANANGKSSLATGLAIASDDKILIAVGEDKIGKFDVVRYTANGALDPTFGTNGLASTSFGGQFDGPTALAVQSDGAVVEVGGIAAGTGMVRFTAAGILDSGFGVAGKVTAAFGNSNGFAGPTADVAIELDGKVLLATNGNYTSFDRSDFVLARYTAAGVLDPSFGTNGVVHTDFAVPGSPDYTWDDVATKIALTPEGRPVVAGLAGFYSSAPKLALARYLVDGTSDIPPPTGSPQLDPMQDSGSSSVDGLTNINAYLKFTGVHTNITGASLQLLRDGEVVASASDGIPLFDLGPVSNGTHHYTARQVNAFGRSGTATAALTITIDTAAPAAPPAPTLDSKSDTGTLGDNRTKDTHPKLIGTAEPGSTLTLRDDNDLLITSIAVGSDGTYSVQFPTTLPSGAITVHVRATDAAGNRSGPSGDLTLTILADISPTLIVSVHGQEVDEQAIGKAAIAAAASYFVTPLIGAGVLSYDAVTGTSTGGSGRQRDAWQDSIGGLAQSIFVDNGTGPAVIKSLEVNWDTYGSEHDPAQEVASRINAIVADTSYDDAPWDILLVGYSRGGPFVHEIMKGLDLVTNQRIDYSEVILLDPTASKVSGDVFPDAMPPGLDQEIMYDDGYSFPLTQLTFHAWGKEYHAPLLTNDGNTGNRVAGADYRYVRSDMQHYLGLPPQGSGNDAADSLASHSAVPYWYTLGIPHRTLPTQFSLDLNAFLAAKDHGATSSGGKVKLVDDPATGEIFSPSSASPNFRDAGKELGKLLGKFVNGIIDDARQRRDQIVKAAEQLIKGIAASAKKAGDALVAAAKKLGGEALAEAKRQAANLLKAAQSEINKLQAEAKKTADALYKEGKLFGAKAAKEVDLASKKLSDIQKAGQKTVAKLQKDANQKVDAVKKAVAAKLAQAKEAARIAQEKLAAAAAKAEAEARAAAAALAAEAEKAKLAAEAEAQHIADVAKAAADKVSSGIKNVRKKFHF